MKPSGVKKPMGKMMKGAPGENMMKPASGENMMKPGPGNMMKGPPGENMMKGGGDMMKKGPPGPGGVMKAEKGPPPMTNVPYRKLFHWGWVVVSAALGPFITTTFLSIFNQTLLQFNVKVFAALVGSMKSDGAAPMRDSESASVFAPLIPTGVTALFALFAGLTLLWIVLAFAEKMLTSWSDNVMLARLQRRLHDQLIRLGPTYHRGHDVGETTMVVSRFATGTQLLLRDLVSAPIVRTFGIATALFMLYDTMATLGDTPFALKLALFAALIAIPAVGVRAAKGLRGAFSKVRDSDLAVAEELQNSLAQPLEVQLMGAETQRSAAFADKLSRHAKNKVSAAVRNELTSQLQTTAPTLLQLGFLAYGVHLATSAASADATAGIVAIYYFVPAAIQPLQQLLQFFNGLNSAWPQVEKVVEILEVAPEVEDVKDARALPAGEHDVQVDNVVFSYGPGLPPVLDGLTHTFTVGQCWALVGASGSGKSTVFSLISRLCDPQQGTVRVGGVSVREVGLASLRGRVVRVAQFPLFIHDTVRANFQLAKADATDEEIQAICERTGLWDILCRASGDLPLEYLLPRDVSQGLSGGQRRLLAVTRALILQPSVLLLDEPSTGLDNITLQQVIRVIREFKAKTAILVVDHDIEGFVARVADGICVLEQGKIVATGSHQELAGKDGLYRRLIEASKDSSGDAPPAPDDVLLHAGELKVS